MNTIPETQLHQRASSINTPSPPTKLYHRNPINVVSLQRCWRLLPATYYHMSQDSQTEHAMVQSMSDGQPGPAKHHTEESEQTYLQTEQPSNNLFPQFGRLHAELQRLVWEQAAAGLDVPVSHFNMDIIRDADREPEPGDPGYIACFTPSTDLIRRTKDHRALLATSSLSRHVTIQSLGGQLLPINYIPVSDTLSSVAPKLPTFARRRTRLNSPTDPLIPQGGHIANDAKLPTFANPHARRRTRLNSPTDALIPHGRHIPSDDSAKAIIKKGLVPFDFHNSFFSIIGLPDHPSRQVYVELERLFHPSVWERHYAAFVAAIEADETLTTSWTELRQKVGEYIFDDRVIKHLRGLELLAPVITRVAFGFPKLEKEYFHTPCWHALGWGGFMEPVERMMRRFPQLEEVGMVESYEDDGWLAQELPRMCLWTDMAALSSLELRDMLHKWHQWSARNGFRELPNCFVEEERVNKDKVEEEKAEEKKVKDGDGMKEDKEFPGPSKDSLNKRMQEDEDSGPKDRNKSYKVEI